MITNAKVSGMLRAGKIILTVTLVATMLGPTVIDFNESHVFNPAWPPHARFHTVELLAVGIGMALVGLWLLWRRSFFQVAAAVPVVVWGAFFVPLFVPGTSYEEYPGESARLAGIPMNLFMAVVFIVLTLAGYWMCVRKPSAG
ncbi:hypothetical protein LWC34_50345 [Kibdelosporangium philippinense]|uniref:Uncharacterized protein n=2 Tax=Kibdelosporangium philippinense TaxID=211113 RepID=A0ABS8ZX14_9PSEU|nr:DUF6640 family protein [Kibdelosporangium philippinense]MCE7010953.1 hypothetical protein [Kibdelosporangium philippinense]